MDSINFQRIYNIFCDCLECKRQREINETLDELDLLIEECIETNRKLWHLEDIARMHELGYESVAFAKRDIDLTNQYRHDIMNKIDQILHERLNNVVSDELEKLNSETPGTLIDRLTILFIKRFKIVELINIIEEDDLKEEFLEKEKLINEQIDKLGNFLDIYFIKVKKNDWFFLPQHSLKIYNNPKVRKYINKIQNQNFNI